MTSSRVRAECRAAFPEELQLTPLNSWPYNVYTMSMEDTKLLAYVNFRQSTHVSYHRADLRPREYEPLMAGAIKFVEQDVPTSVLIDSKEAARILEIGIRYLLS